MCFRPTTAQKATEPCPQCGTDKDPLAVCSGCGFVPDTECPKCKTKNPVISEQCSNCGYKAPKAPPPPGVSAGGAGPKMPPPGMSGGITPPQGATSRRRAWWIDSAESASRAAEEAGRLEEDGRGLINLPARPIDECPSEW